MSSGDDARRSPAVAGNHRVRRSVDSSGAGNGGSHHSALTTSRTRDDDAHRQAALAQAAHERVERIVSMPFAEPVLGDELAVADDFAWQEVVELARG